MWTFFFVCAILGVIVLMFHLILQLNEIEKLMASLTEKIKKHYEIA